MKRVDSSPSEKQSRGAKLAEIGFVVTALGLIGAGVWWIYPPAALIAVGALMWIDLSIGGRK